MTFSLKSVFPSGITFSSLQFSSVQFSRSISGNPRILKAKIDLIDVTPLKKKTLDWLPSLMTV